MMIDPNDPCDLEESERINHRVVSRALAMGGTCFWMQSMGKR